VADAPPEAEAGSDTDLIDSTAAMTALAPCSPRMVSADVSAIANLKFFFSRLATFAFASSHAFEHTSQTVLLTVISGMSPILHPHFPKEYTGALPQNLRTTGEVDRMAINNYNRYG